MTCRTCSAEIDDKAIICYRCGSPTAEASTLKTKPVPINRARLWLAVGVGVGIALAVAGWYFYFLRPFGPS